MLNNKKGFTLIVSLVLIIFVATAVAGITLFVTQRLFLTQTEQIRTRCVYLAQAGVNSALYWYRQHDFTGGVGFFSLGQTNIDASNFFVIGGNAADLLMINTSNSRLNNRNLDRWELQNATDSRDITIDRMIVSWSGGRPGTRLNRIRIDGKNVWNGNSFSPANCNLNPDFILDVTPGVPPTIYSGNRNQFRFSQRIDNRRNPLTSLSAEFIMSDGSSKTIQIYPSSNRYCFTVKSTGKTSGSGIYRTIRAEYNALTGNVDSLYEIDTEITP